MDAFSLRLPLNVDRFRHRIWPIGLLVIAIAASTVAAVTIARVQRVRVDLPRTSLHQQVVDLDHELAITRLRHDTLWRPEYEGQSVKVSFAGEPTRSIDPATIEALEHDLTSARRELTALEAIPDYAGRAWQWTLLLGAIGGPLLVGLLVAPGRRILVTVEQHRVRIDDRILRAVDIVDAHRDDRHLVIRMTRETLSLGPFENEPTAIDLVARAIRQVATDPLERAEERRARGQIEHDYRVRVASWLDRA